MKKIFTFGLGYVGLSMSVLLAQRNQVVAVDVVQEKVDLINAHKSPIVDQEISDFLENKKLNLTAKISADEDIKAADFVVVATPTNYDPDKNFFDTSSVDAVIDKVIKLNSEATIIIKSTIPVGYTKKKRTETNSDKIIFSPEFLREGRALQDNLYPSRIIVGDTSKAAQEFANLLSQAAEQTDTPILLMSSTEAEAVKLFANTYLAMRVAFFNELDTYAEIKNLNAKNIISGISLDPRIGNYYNNPSFGYGGYCLPKDTKQLVANFNDVPNDLIKAVVAANDTRIKHVADSILAKKPRNIGIYRLTMKNSSDNFRESSIQKVIKLLQKDSSLNIFIYEPMLKTDQFSDLKVIKQLDEFKQKADIIIANRKEPDLADVKDKVYTRDLFTRD